MYICPGCYGQPPSGSMTYPSSGHPPWPSRTATGHRVPRGGSARPTRTARGAARGGARRVELMGYGQEKSDLAFFTACEIDCKAEANMVADGIARLLSQLGGSTSISIWEEDGRWCFELAITPFLVVTPTTITSSWYDETESVGGEEILDAIGDGFVEAVRSVDDLNRELGVSDSNHRIDMGSVVVESDGGRSRFTVTVYPPVGVGDEGEGPIGEVEPTEKKMPKWAIGLGIGVGVLAIGAVVGGIVWMRRGDS
jgi:hypothetical protein